MLHGKREKGEAIGRDGGLSTTEGAIHQTGLLMVRKGDTPVPKKGRTEPGSPPNA